MPGSVIRPLLRASRPVSLLASENRRGALDRSTVLFAPSAVTLSTEEPHGSARNVWRGPVDSVELVGQTARVRILTRPDGIPLLAEVTTASVATLRLQPGTEVWAAVKAIEVSAYPA